MPMTSANIKIANQVETIGRADNSVYSRKKSIFVVINDVPAAPIDLVLKLALNLALKSAPNHSIGHTINIHHN